MKSDILIPDRIRPGNTNFRVSADVLIETNGEDVIRAYSFQNRSAIWFLCVAVCVPASETGALVGQEICLQYFGNVVM